MDAVAGHRGVVVGLVGFISQQTLGVGHENIDMLLNGQFVGTTLAVFCVLQFVSWSIALGSGTSGGTLAPFFTIRGGIGVLTEQVIQAVFPYAGVDLCMAGLIGMAASIAGASRALFISVVFAMEITGQFDCLLPLMVGCTTAFIVSALIMGNTIMTERLVRRGHYVPSEYAAVSHKT